MLGTLRAGVLLRNPALITATGVFGVALVARLIHLLHIGAVTGTNGYDQSVYYAASDAMVHGRVPYRGDFVFLHPPGIALVGVPFAFLGRLTTAPIGFMAENIAFAVLGACVAALITVVAGRAGAPRWAAVTGGLIYATWSVTVAAGSSVRLEPLGDLLFVAGIYLLDPGRTPSRRRLLVAGVAFGLLLNIKLWWIVPIGLVFLLMSAKRRELREMAVVPISSAATAFLIDLPFLVLSRGHMFTSVVSSQLGRPAVQGTPSGDYTRMPTMVRLERLTGTEGAMNGLFGFTPAEAGIRVQVVTLVVCALMVITSALALGTTLGRVFVPVLAAQVVILLATPIYFPYYGDFIGISLAMVVAGAAGPISRRPRALPWPSLWLVGAAGTMLLLLTSPRGLSVTDPPDSAALTHATKHIGCVVADTPRVLIALDALDRSFESGCRNWVDFQGVGHGAGPNPNANLVGRHANPAWRRTMSRYFQSGDAIVLSNPSVRVFLGRARTRSLTSGQLVARSQNVSVYLTNKSGTASPQPQPDTK